MYKVFIDNRALLLTTKKPLKFKGKIHNAEAINKCDDNLLKDLFVNNNNQAVCLLCENPKNELMRLFIDYEFIKAAGGIAQRGKSLLFIKRNDIWDIPKGKLEFNEDSESCALREVEEECGLSGVTISQFLTRTYHTYSFLGKPVLKETFWYLMDYKGSAVTTPQLEEGITEAKWFSEDLLYIIKNNTYASICEVLEVFEELNQKET